MSDEEPPIIVTKKGRVGHILLNRPRAINALNAEMVAVMLTTLRQWIDDPEVATVLVTGAGDRGLCAGGDIVSIYQDARDGGTESASFWRSEYVLNALIASYPKPYVAIQDGIVLGGGIGISAHGSVRIVTERSRLGLPETGIGFVPDIGAIYLLSRSPGELGIHAALTAGHFGAADAILLGLSDHFVPSARLGEFATALATESVPDVVARFTEEPPAGALAAQQPWIDLAYEGDDAEAIVARLTAEPQAADALAAISTKSPTAVKATLASLRRALALPDLEADLVQEFRVSLHFLAEPDLAEGIRAQVIDKDRSPKWNPANLAEVSDAHIDSLFDPLPDDLVLEKK